ncbi:methyl-accepting chemotaxis protein [Halosolutus amylolyticus]|uniref:Methyl-accepting chemotaxis protein n=1 Tax=Halosolutus amylolyticus TaxID=2932267 RepID=A0ABD5PPA3_9EURY|nr:methyl-accepting chemotaxis protein [Halosolutus amylolyticus]
MKGSLRRLVPSVIRRSYALKFGIVLLLLALSVGAIGLVATAQITEDVEQNALDEYETVAVQEATTIDNWHQRNERLVSSNTKAPVMVDGTEDEIQSYLRQLKFELPADYVDIHYVDTTSGELVATTAISGDTLDDLDFPDTAGLEDVSTSDVERTEPYAIGGDTAVVSYYRGIEDVDDRALVVTVNLEERTSDIASSNSNATSTIVVDENGEIVADDEYLGSDLGSFQQSYQDDAGILEQAFGGDESGAITVDEPPSETLQDEPYDFAPGGYVAAYQQTDTGWAVLVHTSDEEAYGFVNTVNQFGTIATIAGVVLIGLVGAVIGRNTATSVDRLTGKVEEMEQGDLDVEFETNRIDNIGRLYDGFASMRDELKRQITEAEDARADAERERERVQQINDELQAAAAEYGDVMEGAADGDLTVRMDPDVSDNETMQAIATDFNEMLVEIETTIDQLNRFATDVATASEQVTASSEEVKVASQQVTESIQEISDGADEQYESLRSVDAEMNNLSTTTEEIAAASNEVADVAERTARTSRDGHEAVEDAIEACETLEEERESVVSEFDQLREEVDQVDDLIDRIAEIAEQTNMLALNANIEASRSAAGDDDGGFSAVASEVKELSQDVKVTAEEIDRRLEEIQVQTERSADEVDRTSEEIQHVNDLVTNAGSALEEIAEYAQETNDGVQSISATTEEQAASTQEVVAMVDEVGTIAEETTAEAQNVAASAEEQTSALTEVTASADDLSQQAVALSEALDRFETDADASSDAAAIESESVSTADATVGAADATDTSDAATGDDSATDPSNATRTETDDDEPDKTGTDETFTFGG